jgi:hypothetical protein
MTNLAAALKPTDIINKNPVIDILQKTYNVIINFILLI